MIRGFSWLLLALMLALGAPARAGEPYDIVIRGGRVIDPETQLDAVRDVGISGTTIAAVSATALTGHKVIDATGLVVAPGFIDLHWHGRDPLSDVYQLMDGVTSWFELEVGTDDVDAWYAAREDKSLLNYGVAVGHVPVRMSLFNDPGDFLPAGDAISKTSDAARLDEIKRRIERGLKRGAVGVGFGLAYTPAATHWEVLEIFRTAARYQAPVAVHIRGASSAGSTDREQGLMEVIAHAAVSGAALHVVHIQSSGQSATARMLGIIDEARRRGIDVSTECYPYTAGATRIESFLFASWEDKPEAEYQKLQWAATGERLTKESFQRYRKQGGLVLIHANTEEVIRAAVTHPLTMFASDGFDVYPGNGHPRSAGTYTRILGRYVRELGLLSLPEAIKKMTLMPAQRLEQRVPAMRERGRVQVGAVADVTVFDTREVIDTATYEEPAKLAIGVQYVLVNGVMAVEDGTSIGNIAPGVALRAAVVP